MEFKYTQDISVDCPIMHIDKHIGYDKEDGYGIIGSDFKRELLALVEMGKKQVDVWINSPGGIVTDGMDIYSAILDCGIRVDTYCKGIAASIAGVIFQAGRTRCMSDYAQLMYHNPYNESGEEDKGLDAIRQSIVVMIEKRNPSIDKAEVERIMNKTTWISAEEALKAGFCDEISESDEKNKKRIATAPNARAAWKESILVLNKLNSNNQPQMEKVLNKLKLNRAANEEAVLDAINSMEMNHAEALNKSNKKAEDLEDKITKMEDELKKAKSDLADMKKAKAEDDDKAKAKAEDEEKAKAEDYVKDAVATGKIKNEEATVKVWKDRFVADFAGTKAILDTIAPTKIGAKFVEVAAGGVDPSTNHVKWSVNDMAAKKLAEAKASDKKRSI